MRDALVQEIDEDGEIIHVEMKNREGEHLIGVYQLIGWTKPSKKVKTQAELELYVPPKITHPIQSNNLTARGRIPPATQTVLTKRIV